MKKIKVKVKEKALPNLKGIDICHTIYKDFAEEVSKYGEVQAYYRHTPVGDFSVMVRLLKYGNEQYFMVRVNEEIISCIVI